MNNFVYHYRLFVDRAVLVDFFKSLLSALIRLPSATALDRKRRIATG